MQICRLCISPQKYWQGLDWRWLSLTQNFNWREAPPHQPKIWPYKQPGAVGCHVFVQCDTYWAGCSGDCNRLASWSLSWQERSDWPGVIIAASGRALCKDGLLARLAESTGMVAFLRSHFLSNVEVGLSLAFWPWSRGRRNYREIVSWMSLWQG